MKGKGTGQKPSRDGTAVPGHDCERDRDRNSKFWPGQFRDRDRLENGRDRSKNCLEQVEILAVPGLIDIENERFVKPKTKTIFDKRDNRAVESLCQHFTHKP